MQKSQPQGERNTMVAISFVLLRCFK